MKIPWRQQGKTLDTQIETSRLPVDFRKSTAQHRFLLFCPEHSATQEIHFLRPLRKASQAGKCAVTLVTERDLAVIGSSERRRAVLALWEDFRPTVVVFSRYAGEHYRLLLDTARAQATPVVAHLDDDLFDVPEEIGAAKRKFHSAPARLEALDAIFRETDLIYVPTEPLAARIREYGYQSPCIVPPIQVAADPEEIGPPVIQSGEHLTIGYMGSASHQLDLEMVVPALEQLLEERPTLRFETFGTVRMPENLARFQGQIWEHPPEPDYDSFVAKLRQLSWSVGLAPLRPTQFNEYRTYTKWLEYTMAGTCVVASDCSVYQVVLENGGGVLVGLCDWLERLESICQSADYRLRCTTSASHLVATQHVSAILGEFLIDSVRDRALLGDG